MHTDESGRTTDHEGREDAAQTHQLVAVHEDQQKQECGDRKQADREADVVDDGTFSDQRTFSENMYSSRASSSLSKATA